MAHLVVKPNNYAGNNELLPKHWFCAALSSPGVISKKETESSSELQEVCSDSPLCWIDYWTEDFEKDAISAATQFGFSEALVFSLVGDPPITYQDFDTEMGVRLPSVQVIHFDVTSSPLLILLKKGVVLTIHPLSMDRRFARLRRYSDTVLKKIPQDAPVEDKMTLLLMRIIDENNDRNFEDLRSIEERGDKLSENLVDPKTPREKLGVEIYQMKHALITYLDSLWETVDVLHALRYGDAELVTNDSRLLTRMAMLADSVG